MSEHTEWGKIWSIVKESFGPRNDWPHFEFDGQRRFHIHDARYHLSTLGPEWQILHGFGYNYGPEEWVGNPWHFINRNSPRSPIPDDFTAHPKAVIPPDYVVPPEGWTKAWHWTIPECKEKAKSMGLQWP